MSSGQLSESETFVIDKAPNTRRCRKSSALHNEPLLTLRAVRVM